MHVIRNWMRSWMLATVLVVAAACGDGGPTVVDPVTAVTVSPAAATLVAGESRAFDATVHGASGEVLDDRAVTWTSDDERVARVAPDGRVTAAAAGRTTITATSGGRSGTAAVEVVAAPVPVASVEIRPGGEIPLAPGLTLQLEAVAKAADGSVLANRPVAWSTAIATVATVSAGGLLQAHAVGATAVTATVEGVSAQALVRVRVVAPPVARLEIAPAGPVTLLPGATRQLAATAYAADGSELPGRPVTWATNDAAVVAVSAGGMLEARAAGRAFVTARTEGQLAQVEVVVAPRVAYVEVDPPVGAIAVGDVLYLRAQPRADDDAPLDRPVTWTTADPAVATVNATGRVLGVRGGVTRITATSEGRSTSIELWVYTRVDHPLVRVGDAALPTTLFTVTEPDAGGTPRSARWEVYDGRLRLESFGRFEQALALWIHPEGSTPFMTSWIEGGTYEYDVVNGGIVFRLYDGRTFRGAVRPDGTFTVTRRLRPDAPELTFVHRVP